MFDRIDFKVKIKVKVGQAVIKVNRESWLLLSCRKGPNYGHGAQKLADSLAAKDI